MIYNIVFKGKKGVYTMKIKMLALLGIFTLLSIICFSKNGFSQETTPAENSQADYFQEKIVAFGLGIGGVASPGMFAGKFNADILIDDMFSIGPYFQTGMKSDYNIFMITLDGKFRYSFEGVPDEIKFLGIVGFGYLLRDMPLFNDHDFTAKAGIGAEYYFTDYVSLGLETSVNITGTDNDRVFANFIVGVHYFI